MSAFFAKDQHFLVKIVPLLKAIVWDRCWKFFSFVFSFCKIKGNDNENISFTDYVSRIRLPDCSKLAINQKSDNDITICQQNVIAKFFWRFLVSLVKFIYWSKFHFSIITGSKLAFANNAVSSCFFPLFFNYWFILF